MNKGFKVWFNNLSKASRLSFCLLSGLFLTSIIVIPIISCSNSVTKTTVITGTGSDLIKSVTLAKQDDGSYKGKIELQEGKSKDDIYSIVIKANDKKLIVNIEYTLNTNTGELIINKDIINGDEKICIEIKKKEIVSESNIDWNNTKFDSSFYGFFNESVYDKAKIASSITFKKDASLSGVLVGEDASKDKIYANYDINTKSLNIWSTGTIVFRDNDLIKVDDESFGLFYSCPNVSSIYIDNVDTSKMTIMKEMFGSCLKLTSLNLSTFDTSKVEDMSYMFHYCESLKSLDLSKFKTSKATTMAGMFLNCSSLTSLNLSNFDTSKVIDMGYMFENASSLTSLDLSNFNTSKVEKMANMFLFCKSMTNVNVSSFNTSNVNNMINMFGHCEKLSSIDLSNFDTSNVVNMSYMFANCKELTSIDISSFTFEEIVNTQHMFASCSSVTTIYAKSGTDLKNKVSELSSYNMFYGCTNLKGGSNTTYNENNVNKDYAHIDGGEDNPGYFAIKNATL